MTLTIIVLIIIIGSLAFANGDLINDREKIHRENIELNHENLRLRSKHEYLTGKEDEQILIVDIDVFHDVIEKNKGYLTTEFRYKCPIGNNSCKRNMLSVSKSLEQHEKTCSCCFADYLLNEYLKQIRNSNSPLKGLHKAIS